MGLNPYLHQPIGWTLVDEHILGALFIALGKNCYMAGQNESSPNSDLTLPGTACEIGGQTVVFEGKIVLEGESDENG